MKIGAHKNISTISPKPSSSLYTGRFLVHVRQFGDCHCLSISYILIINIFDITFQVFLLKYIPYLRILLKFVSSLLCYVPLGVGTSTYTFVRPQKKKRSTSTHNFIQVSSMKLRIYDIFRQQDEDCVSLNLARIFI